MLHLAQEPHAFVASPRITGLMQAFGDAVASALAPITDAVDLGRVDAELGEGAGVLGAVAQLAQEAGAALGEADRQDQEPAGRV